MSISWPADIVARECEFYLQNNTRDYMSPITRTRQAIRGQGERWMAHYLFRVVGRRGRARMDALLDQGKGSFENFLMWDHDQTEPNGTNLDRSSIPDTFFTDGTSFTEGSPQVLTAFSAGAPGITVHGDHTIRATDVEVDGFPGGTSQLDAGDYVEIGGFLYRLTADAEADAVGRAVLSLNRGLVTAVTDGISVNRTRASTPMYLVDDDQPRRTADANHVYDYSLNFAECLVP